MNLLQTSCAVAALMAAYVTPAFGQEDQYHVEEIVVSSHPIGQKSSEVAQAVSILSGEALERLRGRTLGETLDQLPGLSQSSFGPGASRPVIRGIGGDRIRILIAGIGSIDASSTSPDHTVAFDPETAEKIEVLRGPATLLFGSNAVGGAINIFDGRIPTRQPENGLKAVAHAHYGLNGDEVNASAWVTSQVQDNFALHVDGTVIDRGDMDIPGYAESAVLRSLEDTDAADAGDGEDHNETYGTVPNTGMNRKSGAVGGTWFGSNAFFGMSLSGFDTNYGLPSSAHGHADTVEEPTAEPGAAEAVRIALNQLRFDAMGQYDGDLGLFERAKFRFGYADYEHKELEGEATGTVFKNQGWESRLEFIQKQAGKFNGAFGVQYRDRDFEAIGDEAFVPASKTKQFGVFLLERWEGDHISLEAGARVEWQTVNTDLLDRKETSTSLSAAAVYRVAEDWQIALNGFNTERAPNAEELLSDGPHLATSSYERGNTSLDKETARGLELSVEKTQGNLTGGVTVFYTHYDQFIYQAITGEEEDGLPVAEYTAADARFWGIEAQASAVLYSTGPRSVSLDLGADYVRATNLTEDTPLPRIPPLSVSASAMYQSPLFDLHLDISWADSQKRLAPTELWTDSYWAMAAGLTYHPQGPEGHLHLFIEGRNLLDQDIRYHTSFLKDILPEAGRDIRVGVKATF